VRLRVLLILLLVAAAAGFAAPARAASAPSLAQAAGTRFPDRTYALTLPRAVTLAPSQVEVRENGRIVPGVVLEPADGAGGRRFGVVLVIDTSGSMRGRPLRAAVAAAREFVAHRGALQPVAVMTFAGEVRVALPFTTDAAAIERALAAIQPAPGGSRVLDAAARASQLVRDAKLQSGSVVLLSDGADNGSHSSLEQVAAVASASGVRLYTVGLRSTHPNFGTLNLLAATTHGEFAATTSVGDLSRVYARLGSLLAHQYAVRYRSAARPGERVQVQVRVEGFPGGAVTSYVAPRAPVGHRQPFHHAPSEQLWLRPGAAVGVSIFCMLLLTFSLWLALRPSGRSLRSRVAAYVGPAEPKERPRRRQPVATGLDLGRVRASRTSSSRWMSLRETLDVGRISITAERLVAWVAGTTLVLLVLLPLITGAPVAALLAFAVPLAARGYIERNAHRQRRLFTEQLPDNLQVMASALRAGHSFAGSLAVVAEDAPEPTRREFERAVADERLGVPMDEALGAVVERMQSKDLAQVALVATLQRDTGGNTAEVLERVTETVRDRVAVQRLVRTLTAQGRMSRWVLTAIPIGLLVLLTAINPTYMHPLWATTAGHSVLVLAAVMVVSGSLVIKRIVNIKV
jgi:tight adherence protein B